MQADIGVIEESHNSIYFTIYGKVNIDGITFMYDRLCETLHAWENEGRLRSKWVTLKDYNLMTEAELFQESLVHNLNVPIELLAKIQVQLTNDSGYFLINKKITIDY